jgi:hypothetical protein
VAPPAAQGTIRLIGRAGFQAAVCARAASGIERAPAAPAIKPRKDRRPESRRVFAISFMTFSLNIEFGV